MLGSCAAVRRSPGRHSTCQAAGQLSQHTRLPPLWHLATRRCCPHWQRLQERAICPHQRSLFSLLLQKFEKSSRKWRFLEESCPLPARHKPRSSRTFWPKKHPGDLNYFWLPRKNIVENQKTDYEKTLLRHELVLVRVPVINPRAGLRGRARSAPGPHDVRQALKHIHSSTQVTPI